MSYSQPQEPLLFIITGGRGAGKTSFCERMAQAAKDAGWQVSGLLSRPVFDATQRIAIDAEDLRNQKTRRLAVRSDTPTPGTKHWQFDEAVIQWGNQVLEASTPTDLLIVDELGRLEFSRDVGWQAALPVIDSKQYAIAMVVVRAEMLGEVLLHWPNANLIEIETAEESEHKARILSEQLF